MARIGRPIAENPLKKASIRLTDNERRALETIAAENGLNLSAAIRAAIAEYIERHSTPYGGRA